MESLLYVEFEGGRSSRLKNGEQHYAIVARDNGTVII
jgi:hypothetical protein